MRTCLRRGESASRLSLAVKDKKDSVRGFKSNERGEGRKVTEMTHLDLFAGGGGAAWFGKLIGAKCVGYVEKDEYCKRIIRARIRDGIFDDAPIFDDVRTFDGRPYSGRVDLITAGFPCQPFSCAGKRQGESDERNMWPDTVRILREVRPRHAILENVPGLFTTDYIQTVFGDLAAAGFDAEWEVVSAADVGAPHLRKRLWILATDSHRPRRGETKERIAASSDSSESRADGQAEFMADSDDPQEWRTRNAEMARPRETEAWTFYQSQRTSDSKHSRESGGTIRSRSRNANADWWSVEPRMGRVADGVANRVNRLRSLGNGWVPAVAFEFWKRVINKERSR